MTIAAILDTSCIVLRPPLDNVCDQAGERQALLHAAHRIASTSRACANRRAGCKTTPVRTTATPSARNVAWSWFQFSACDERFEPGGWEGLTGGPQLGRPSVWLTGTGVWARGAGK